MTQWNLVITDDTDRHVRSYLARTGGTNADLSKFVDRAVRQRIFWETVEKKRSGIAINTCRPRLFRAPPTKRSPALVRGRETG